MQFIDELEGLVSSRLTVLKIFLSMTRLEAKLAGLSIFPLLINLCLLLTCILCAWLTAMSMLGYALMLVLDNAIIAMACVFLCHALLLGVLLIYLRFNLKKMSFEKTRAYLSRKDPESNEQKNAHKTAADDSHSPPGQTIMDPGSASQ